MASLSPTPSSGQALGDDGNAEDSLFDVDPVGSSAPSISMPAPSSPTPSFSLDSASSSSNPFSDFINVPVQSVLPPSISTRTHLTDSPLQLATPSQSQSQNDVKLRGPNGSQRCSFQSSEMMLSSFANGKRDSANSIAMYAPARGQGTGVAAGSVRKACDECRAHKLKCSGEAPHEGGCLRCQKNGSECVYSSRAKRRPTDPAKAYSRPPRPKRRRFPSPASSDFASIVMNIPNLTAEQLAALLAQAGENTPAHGTNGTAAPSGVIANGFNPFTAPSRSSSTTASPFQSSIQPSSLSASGLPGIGLPFLPLNQGMSSSTPFLPTVSTAEGLLSQPHTLSETQLALLASITDTSGANPPPLASPSLQSSSAGSSSLATPLSAIPPATEVLGDYSRSSLTAPPKGNAPTKPVDLQALISEDDFLNAFPLDLNSESHLRLGPEKDTTGASKGNPKANGAPTNYTKGDALHENGSQSTSRNASMDSRSSASAQSFAAPSTSATSTAPSRPSSSGQGTTVPTAPLNGFRHQEMLMSVTTCYVYLRNIMPLRKMSECLLDALAHVQLNKGLEAQINSASSQSKGKKARASAYKDLGQEAILAAFDESLSRCHAALGDARCWDDGLCMLLIMATIRQVIEGIESAARTHLLPSDDSSEATSSGQPNNDGTSGIEASPPKRSERQSSSSASMAPPAFSIGRYRLLSSSHGSTLLRALLISLLGMTRELLEMTSRKAEEVHPDVGRGDCVLFRMSAVLGKMAELVLQLIELCPPRSGFAQSQAKEAVVADGPSPTKRIRPSSSSGADAPLFKHDLGSPSHHLADADDMPDGSEFVNVNGISDGESDHDIGSPDPE